MHRDGVPGHHFHASLVPRAPLSSHTACAFPCVSGVFTHCMRISMRLWCLHTLHARCDHACRTHLVGSANIRIPRLPVDSSYSGFTGVEDKRERYGRDSFVARCCQAVSAVTRQRVTGEGASRKNKPSEPDCCQISSPHSACLQDPALIFSCKGATAFRSPFVYLSERYSEAAASDKQSTLIRRLL